MTATGDEPCKSPGHSKSRVVANGACQSVSVKEPLFAACSVRSAVLTSFHTLPHHFAGGVSGSSAHSCLVHEPSVVSTSMKDKDQKSVMRSLTLALRLIFMNSFAICSTVWLPAQRLYYTGSHVNLLTYKCSRKLYGTSLLIWH